MNRYVVFGIVSFLFIGFIAIVLIFAPRIFKDRSPGYEIDLEVWGVFDTQSHYSEAFRTYKEFNPFLDQIKYRKFTIDSYEEDLRDALISGNGPDVFMIHATWLPKYMDSVVPIPQTLMVERELREQFVDVVSDDVVSEGQIFGLPLSVDSLSLYYNRDLFNAAGITSPPTTWGEFLEVSQNLTSFDQDGRIMQSGAVMGTAYNVNRSTDILSLLFLQNGMSVARPGTTEVSLSDQRAENAMNFYTQFADVRSQAYSWNARQDYSIDAFIEGNAAMMINYSWHYETVMRKNEKLRFGVSRVPQLSGQPPVNYANYWIYVVPKLRTISDDARAKRVTDEVRIFEAWQMLKYLTTARPGQVRIVNAASGTTKDFPNPIDPAESYLQRTKKPAARRDLLEGQKNDLRLGPFAEGNLIARSYKQEDAQQVEGILAEAIASVNFGAESTRSALGIAQERINKLRR